MVPVCHRKSRAIEMNMVLLAYLLEMKKPKKKRKTNRDWKQKIEPHLEEGNTTLAAITILRNWGFQ
jgi:hypothetical protein